jgi:predicted metal-dependent enzyme (double-stranded beta helix superfamily)
MFEQAYGRLVCHVDGEREVIAMKWKQGATCAVHDHGATASGRVHLVVGALVEERFTFDGRALQPTERLLHAAPCTIEVPPGLIHRMTASPDAALTLSIHHYEPCIASMRIYDPEGRRTVIVPDDGGAWIPEDAAAIVAIEPWSAL